MDDAIRELLAEYKGTLDVETLLDISQACDSKENLRQTVEELCGPPPDDDAIGDPLQPELPSFRLTHFSPPLDEDVPHPLRKLNRKKTEPALTQMPDPSQDPVLPTASDPVMLVGREIILNKLPLNDVLALIKGCKIEDLNSCTEQGVPLLAFPVLMGDVKLLSELVERGANVDACIKGMGIPLVFIPARIHAGDNKLREFLLQVDGTDKLLRSMSEEERYRMKRRSDVMMPMVFREILRKGANSEVHDEKDHNLEDYVHDSYEMSYWLQRSQDKKIYLPSVKDYNAKIGAPRLGEIYFSLIGEEIGVDLLMKRLTLRISTPGTGNYRKPLVAFLAGPPGSGKSQICEDIARAVVGPSDFYRDNFGSVDAGMLHSHFFGAEQGFIGSDKPPPLASFIREHHGKRAVVIFEEFEKLDTEVLKALLVPFENGEWPMRGGKINHVNCSLFIFLLTSNLRNSEIIRWCTESKEVKELSTATVTDDERDILMKAITNGVTDIISTHYRDTSVKEFTRRIDIVVPFITLIPMEVFALVEWLETLRKVDHFDPPAGEQKWGNIDMVFTRDYNKWLREKYDHVEGASSILRELTTAMADVLEKSRKDPAALTNKLLHFTFDIEKNYPVVRPCDPPSLEAAHHSQALKLDSSSSMSSSMTLPSTPPPYMASSFVPPSSKSSLFSQK